MHAEESSVDQKLSSFDKLNFKTLITNVKKKKYVFLRQFVNIYFVDNFVSTKPHRPLCGLRNWINLYFIKLYKRINSGLSARC